MRKLPLLLLISISACGAAGRGAGTPESLQNLPPRHDPPIDLSDDDDLGRARAQLEVLDLAAPERSARRREIAAAYRARAEGLVNDFRDEAFTRFQTALEMWDPRELRGGKPAPDLDVLEPVAQTFYKKSGASGADYEAVTALVVLEALHPERAAEYEKQWNEIVAFTNELAVAENGPGAERARVIEMLEKVTAHFPSQWAIEHLVHLYLARQEAVTKAIQANNAAMLHAHPDRGLIRPEWNLLRAYARAWRLEDAPAAVDKLTGGFGDQPELRKRLHAALEGKEGKAWLELMVAYMPSEPGEGDGPAALRICQIGSERMPKAVEPKKCVAELARMQDRVPLAIRAVEDGLKLAPDDHDLAEIAARLYLVRIADEQQAERLDLAHRHMAELEAFFGAVAKRFADKPLDTTLADAYLTFGGGLVNLGEIAEAQSYLDRAQKQSKAPLPQVEEERATILAKTGHPREAAEIFEQAAQKKRSTPLETQFDHARLRRLAGEAWRDAGDKKRAAGLFKQSLADWREILGASLPPRLLGRVHGELARCHYELGELDKALAEWGRALDVDSDQGGIYGDAISFLATRGHFREAQDAFHRALGSDAFTEYLRVYTSLWLVDTARINGREPDRLAIEALSRSSKGGRWYHQLARFKLGRLTFDALLAKADTRGKRAEAYFYQAMELYAKKDRAGAERLLGQVTATQMLGFFEYDMARHYLAHGPPVDRKR